MFKCLKAAHEVKAVWSEFLFHKDTFVDKWTDVRCGRVNCGSGWFEANDVGETRDEQSFQKNSGTGANLEGSFALRERSDNRSQRRFVCIGRKNSLFHAIIRGFRVGGS
jgi:hypothetical protein